MSVLLLSRVPLNELSGQTVLVSTQSHTSVALIRILLSLHLGVEARFAPGSCTETLARGELPAAFLAIGDEALRLGRHDLYPYRWDLGEAWNTWTGLPFVFAVWVIQRDAVARENGDLADEIAALLDAKKWGREHIGTICAQALREGILNDRELHDYYRCLRYDLGTDEKKGLGLFYRIPGEDRRSAGSPAPRNLFAPLRAWPDARRGRGSGLRGCGGGRGERVHTPEKAGLTPTTIGGCRFVTAGNQPFVVQPRGGPRTAVDPAIHDVMSVPL